jgi:hypothetical protein
VTPRVVEVGPQTVRGTEAAPPQWVSTAIEFIDDPTALLDEQPVELSALWRDVLGAAAGERADPLVLVVPTWWSSARVDVVSAAARDVASEVVVLQRCPLLSEFSDATADATVVELSAHYAVVSSPASESLIFARADPELAAHLETANAVLLDVPAGVPPLPGATSAELRRLGIPVLLSTDDRLRRAAMAVASRHADRNGRSSRRIRPGRRAATRDVGRRTHHVRFRFGAGAGFGAGWRARPAHHAVRRSIGERTRRCR